MTTSADETMRRHVLRAPAGQGRTAADGAHHAAAASPGSTAAARARSEAWPFTRSIATMTVKAAQRTLRRVAGRSDPEATVTRRAVVTEGTHG